MLKFLKYLLIFLTMNVSAQKIMFDSSLNHFCILENIKTKKGVYSNFKEYYGDKLLSRGYYYFEISQYNIDLINKNGIRYFYRSMQDTCIFFNLFGDTLEFSIFDKGEVKETIQYLNNARIYHQNKTRGFVWQLTESGSIYSEKSGKKTKKIIINENGKIRTFIYSGKFETAPYYEKETDAYYALSNTFKITDRIKKSNKNIYLISKLSIYEGGEDYPYFKSMLVSRYNFISFKRKKLSRKRYHTKDYKVISLIDSNAYKLTEIKYDKRGNLSYHKQTQIRKSADLNRDKVFDKFLIQTFSSNILTYSSENFSGSVKLKKEGFEHFDTFNFNSDIYHTFGNCINGQYYFKTYKNGNLFKSSTDYFHYNYKSDIRIDEYEDGFKSYLINELHYKIHNIRFNHEDTNYLSSDSKLIFNSYQIQLHSKGNVKVLFDSIYVNNSIAKDQAICGMGVKNQYAHWIIPAKFDHIQMVNFFSNINGYYANINDYACIYDNTGRILIPMTRGLSSSSIPLSLIGKKDNDFYNSTGWICNDLTNDSFKIIDIDNKIRLSGKGRFEMIPKDNPNALIYSIRNGKLLEIFNRNGKIVNSLIRRITLIGKNRYLLSIETEMNSSDTLQLIDLENTQLNGLKFSHDKTFDYIRVLTNKSQQLIFLPNGNYILNNENEFINLKKINGYYLIEKDTFVGLMDNNGKILVPPKYKNLSIGIHVILAHTDKETSFYNPKGELLKTTGRVHVLNETKENYSIYQIESFYNVRNEHKSLIKIKENDKLGLIDNEGNKILNCEYEEIVIYNMQSYNYNSSYNLNYSVEIYCLKGTQVLSFKIDKGVFRKYYPKEAFMFYDQTSNSQHLIDKSGNILIKNRIFQRINSVHNQNVHYFLMYENNEKYNERKLTGKLDHQGKLIISFDQFKNIRPIGKYYYVQTNANQCGILDENLNFIIKAQYSHIHTDMNQQFFWFKRNENELWKLCRFSHPETILDSFDCPVNIERNTYNIPVSRNGYWGLIDNMGNTIQTPRFQGITFTSQYNLNPFAKLNGQIHVMVGKDSSLRLNYKTLYTSFNRNTGLNIPKFASRADMIYYLEYFNAIDSSKDLFLKSTKQRRSQLFYSSHSLSQNINSNRRIYENKRMILHINENTHGIYNYSWHYPYQVETFPNTSCKNYNNIEFGAVAQKDEFEYKENDTLNFRDLAGKVYKFHSESKNTLTFFNKKYLNIFFDTADNAIKFNLNSIIDPYKKENFISHLHERWLKLENPAYPCIDKSKIFEYFEDNFAVNNGYFILYPYTVALNLTIEEIEPFLKAEWKGRF